MTSSSGSNSSGSYSTIVGGYGNQTLYDSFQFIGGGVENETDNDYTTLVGGNLNYVQGLGSFLGGGTDNKSRGTDAAVTGGTYNTLNSCDFCFIGGGGENSADGAGDVIAGGGIDSAIHTVGNVGGGISSSILGGAGNAATGDYSTVGGGSLNAATGSYSAIPGGYSNDASGQYSFAGGSSATAAAEGAFVWADSQGNRLISNTANEFKVRAGGGFVLLSSTSSPTVIVSSGSLLISTSPSAASAVPNLFISSTDGNVGLGTTRPGSTLDVSGSAQFGSGARKSTFTATPGGAIYALYLSTGLSITNGYLKLPPGGGIQFGDNSISTTANSGGGSGNVTASGDNAFTGKNTHAGEEILLSGSTLTATLGTYCAGIQCLVGHSSGTADSFSFAISSGAAQTYSLDVSVHFTSGTTSNPGQIYCNINNDGTPSHYYQAGLSYPDPYNWHSTTFGIWYLGSCGGGAVNGGTTGDIVQSHLTITTWGNGNIMSHTGTWSETCQSRSYVEQGTLGGQYFGSAPWTIKCYPVSTLGWEYDATLYKTGK